MGSIFRRAVGFLDLKSTRFNVNYDGSNYNFTGKRFSHGVGMCQRGAIGMANSGYSHIAILRHYFSGIIIDYMEPPEDTTGPTITHTAITTATRERSIDIRATVTDLSGASSVELFYKRRTQNVFTSSSMTLIDSDVFSGRIPADFVTLEGMDYYIHAQNTKGNISYHGSEPNPHKITVYPLEREPPTIGIPEIIPSSPKRGEDEDIVIKVYCSDNTGVKEVNLNYKNEDEINFKVIKMTKIDQNIYHAVILSQWITSNCVHYYITATDYDNNQSQYSSTYGKIFIHVVKITTGETVILTPSDDGKSYDSFALRFSEHVNPISDKLTLRIHNLKGAVIKVIDDNAAFKYDAGTKSRTVVWEAEGDLPAGIYIYTFEKNNSIIKSGKIVIAKYVFNRFCL